MKNYFLILITFIISSIVNAQVPLTEIAANEYRYWKLRGRLTGDEKNRDVYNGFMFVGDGDGKSIPAGIRNPTYGRNVYEFSPDPNHIHCQYQKIDGINTYADYDNLGNIVVGSPLIDPRDGKELKGILKFSDNSLINIGNYLGVLAVEWALLHRENRSTVQTEQEIYFALLAIDRLDYKGESIFGISQSVNGFCMRNDVEEKFQLNSDGKKIDMVSASIACVNEDVDCSESNTTVHHRNTMSQDEVIGLMVGFALMRKMLPFYASYNGIGLRNWSKEICERIIKYVREAGNTNYWAIVDPDQKKRVCRGSKAIFNSYPLAAVADYISGAPINQNGWSLNLGKFMWKIRKNYVAMNNYDAWLFFPMPTGMQADLNLNAYEPIIVPGVTDAKYNHNGSFNVSMMLKLLSTSFTASRPLAPFNDYTGKNLINTVALTYEKNLFELLGSVIYGYFPLQSESYWRGQFNLLPCECNCMQGTNAGGYNGCNLYHSIVPPNIPANGVSFPSNKWALEDRWAFTGVEGGSYPANGVNDPGTFNEYNGLDYMLAFNLYRWKYFAGGYADRVRRDWQQNLPFLTSPNPYDNNNQYQIGSTAYPYEVKAVFSVSSSNTIINTDTKVMFSAGSDVKLLPGFHAKPGAVFKAAVKEFDCQPNILAVPGNQLFVSWKNGVDTFTTSYFSDDMDTIVNIQLDGDSTNFYDEGPPIDTNAFFLTYTNNIDTFVYDLNPDYIFTDSGEIIYAPPQNKVALDEATINNIALFPNPSSTLATVEYTLYQQSEVKLTVTNELGQVMQNVVPQEVYSQSRGKQKVTLHTANLSAGIYFCVVELNGRRQVLKFTVLH